MRGEQRRYERRKRRAGGAEERGGQSESKSRKGQRTGEEMDVSVGLSKLIKIKVSMMVK